MTLAKNPFVQTTVAALLPPLVGWALYSSSGTLTGSKSGAADQKTMSQEDFDRAIASHPAARRLRQLHDIDEFKSFIRSTFHDTKSAEFQKLVDHVSVMPFSDIGYLTTELSEFFEEDDAAAKSWLSALAMGLVEQDNADRSLDICGYLFSNKALPDIERQVLYHITAEGFGAVQERFTNLHKEEQFIDNRQASILLSLAMNERADQKEQVLSWIEGMKGKPELANLQGSFLRNLVRQTEPTSEDFDRLVKLVEGNLDNIKVSTNLPELATRYAPDDPEKTITWLASLDTPDQEMREESYAQVMQDMVLNDLPQAAELLSAENFLELHYKSSSQPNAYKEDGEVTEEAQQFYDRVLGGFMDGLVAADPQTVLDSAGSFFSKEKEAEYRALAQALLEDPALALPACGSAGCTNPDHNH